MWLVIRTISIIIFVSVLCKAISITSDESWLTIWFLLLIFGGVPLSLLAIKDVIVQITPKWLGPSQVLLHLCAVFGALIGYGLGVMAVASEHEKAELHQLLVIIFPVMVYATPLLMVLHGVPLSRIKNFYFKFNDKDGV